MMRALRCLGALSAIALAGLCIWVLLIIAAVVVFPIRVAVAAWEEVP